jgi:hypothetical protein
MKTYNFKIWKFLTILFFILNIFIGYKYFLELKKNYPYKKELKIFSSLSSKNMEEINQLKKQLVLENYFLNEEKERKDKLGEILEGEKVILVSDELLKSINLPFEKN